jgi:hypothetical protein
MSLLDGLLLASFATTVIMFLFGDRPRVARLSVGFYALQLLLAGLLGYQLTPGSEAMISSGIGFTVMGNSMSWAMSAPGMPPGNGRRSNVDCAYFMAPWR